MAVMALASNPLVLTSVGTALPPSRRSTPPSAPPAHRAPFGARARHQFLALASPGKFVITHAMPSPLRRAIPAGPGGFEARAAQTRPSGPGAKAESVTGCLRDLKRLPSNHVNPLVPIP